MDIHDRRTTRKLEKKAVVLEKIRSEATKVLKFHISISCGYFGISTLVAGQGGQQRQLGIEIRRQ
jgi:hypothetical protein